jgi:flagellar biosynthesis protein FlhG
MEKRPYIVLTASSKGGVGKTQIAINVATALKTAGYEVLLIDTDTANPSVGPLLGMRDQVKGYVEIVMGSAKMEDALVSYQPTGFYYIPAGGDGEVLVSSPEEIRRFYSEISRGDFDFVIVDTPPGSNLEAAIKIFDEALIVTTPEETAVLGAQKLSKSYNKYHLLHKLVINRVKKDRYELDKDRIEQLYGDIAYELIPEDEIIEESEAKHLPAYLIRRTSLFSLAIDDLCRSYTLRAGEPNRDEQQKGSGFSIKKFLGMR